MPANDPLANPEPLIRRVYTPVACPLGDGPHTEDVTSTVFERAFRYWETYDPKRGAPATWLIGIARRCVEDALTARTTLESEPPPEILGTTTKAIEVALNRALDRLRHLLIGGASRGDARAQSRRARL